MGCLLYIHPQLSKQTVAGRTGRIELYMATAKRIKKEQKVKEVSPYKRQRDRADRLEAQNESMANKLAENKLQLEAVEQAYAHSQDNVTAGREAWQLEHDLRKQASELLAAQEAEKTSKVDVVHVVFNGLGLTQKVKQGDSFEFVTSRDAGGFSIAFKPYVAPPAPPSIED